MMKNLIIHPEDKSTDFLKPIYEGLENKQVLASGMEVNQLHQLIVDSERVLMMGHGAPQGLFSMRLYDPNRNFYASGQLGLKQNFYVVSSKNSNILQDKTNNVYIWCNADKFVLHNDLHGFYSGMFISEVGEARFCGLTGVTQEQVTKSNNTFSSIVGEHINLPKEMLYEKTIKEYGELANSNPVAQYNLDRLYIR